MRPMQALIRGIFILCLLTIASFLMVEVFNTQFGTVDYWANHGFFFLVFITLFPRLTLLFSSVASGGVFWWLGFFFCPRILVAGLATMAYFKTNPALVVFSWMIAVSGETAEKFTLNRKFVFYSTPVKFKHNFPSPAAGHARSGDVIDVEYKELK